VHYCGKRWKDGGYIEWRETAKKRMVAKFREIKTELKLRRHQPIPTVDAWLQKVAWGYYPYHAVSGNMRYSAGQLSTDARLHTTFKRGSLLGEAPK